MSDDKVELQLIVVVFSKDWCASAQKFKTQAEVDACIAGVGIVCDVVGGGTDGVVFFQVGGSDHEEVFSADYYSKDDREMINDAIKEATDES